MTGRLEVIAGPMYSGKTSELITRIEKAQIAGMQTVIFRPKLDTRGNSRFVQSRNGRTYNATMLSTLLPPVSEVVVNGYEVVGFDEAQFFDQRLVGLVDRLVRNGVRVIVAGLDLDYATMPYGPMPRLLALADVVDKYTAVCMVCHSLYATRTQRMIDGKPAPLGNRDVVDGFDTPVMTEQGEATYEARCLECYVMPR